MCLCARRDTPGSLRHACLHHEHSLVVDHGVSRPRVLFADVTLHIYSLDTTSTVQGSPSQIWVCGLREDVPAAARAVDGRASAIVLGGQRADWTLSTEIVCLQLASGDTLGVTESLTLPPCDVSSLQLDVERTGFAWCPESLPPLQDSGHDYAQLLKAPVLLGLLEPVLWVKAEGHTLELLFKRHETGARLLETLECKLDVPQSEIALFCEGRQLDRGCALAPLMQIEMRRAAWLLVQVVTSCCSDVWSGVTVVLDSEPQGGTDAKGFLSLTTTVGTHLVSLEHPALSRDALQVSVHSKENKIVIRAKAKLFMYAVDADFCDEGVCVSAATCVWVAADPTHMPDGATPLKGSVSARSASTELCVVDLDEYDIVPVDFPMAGLEHSDDEACLFSSLCLNCLREDGRVQWDDRDAPCCVKWCPLLLPVPVPCLPVESCPLVPFTFPSHSCYVES